MLGSKSYVVSSPSLTLAIQKSVGTLSFNPFIVEVFKRMSGMPEPSAAIIRQDMDNKAVESYLQLTQKLEYSSMAPGPGLEPMYHDALKEFGSHLTASLASQPGRPIGLFRWVRDIFTVASTRAMFGPTNPFADPELANKVWEWDAGLKTLIVNIFPSITAPKAYKARNAIRAAFIRYYEDNGQNTASAVVRARHRTATKFNLGIEDMACLDIGLVFGLLVNVVPTAFWLLCHIYSDPTLLAAIRTEFSPLLTRDPSQKKLNINLPPHSALRPTLPLLHSAYQETLRHYATAPSGRYVLADTLITDSGSPNDNPNKTPQNNRTYLLKKGGIIQLLTTPIHFSPAIYGPDARLFNARRFLADPAPAERCRPGEFRAFGGGGTLCPGRHFAIVKILGFVVGVLGLWDFVGDVDGKGEEKKKKKKKGIEVPEREHERISLEAARPEKEVWGRFVGRADGGGGEGGDLQGWSVEYRIGEVRGEGMTEKG
ncbi:MAG: hypothetical protein Q9227_001048 [Pyrenula ochraceoflavens]